MYKLGLGDGCLVTGGGEGSLVTGGGEGSLVHLVTGGDESSLVHLVTGGGESSMVHLVTGGGRVFRSVLLSFSTSGAYLLSVLSVNCVWSGHTRVSGCVCVCACLYAGQDILV